MAADVAPALPAKSLADPQFKEKLQALRRTDNYTNLLYLCRAYLILAVTIGGTVWFYEQHAAWGLSWWWGIPLTVLAILVVGGCQHQLTGLAHEAVHHMLFRARLLGEFVSDWFCMFPVFSSTHHYRLAHLAHHQYVNDPERDPDLAQQKASGHWIEGPISQREAVRLFLKQLWLPNLIRYTRVRFQFDSIGTEHNPYLQKGVKQSKIPVRAGLAYMLGMTASLIGLVIYGDRVLLAVVPAVLWVAIMIFYALIPARWYHQSRMHRTISARAMTLMRMTFLTLLFNGIAWLSLMYGYRFALYFLVLWMVPLFTSFPLYMVLRQIVQHANGDRGWMTNTRVYLMNPIVRFCVFPLGQDYHLPHHMFATIPHYRLPQLHRLLLEYPEYHEQAVVVDGYFFPRHAPPRPPTVVEVLGPAYAPKQPHEAFIDESVMT
jgi:fatty acid desaturase